MSEIQSACWATPASATSEATMRVFQPLSMHVLLSVSVGEGDRNRFAARQRGEEFLIEGPVCVPAAREVDCAGVCGFADKETAARIGRGVPGVDEHIGKARHGHDLDHAAVKAVPECGRVGRVEMRALA